MWWSAPLCIFLQIDLGFVSLGLFIGSDSDGLDRLLHSPSSGVWVFQGALQGEQVVPALSGFDWAVRGTYRTAWAVQPRWRCPYSYGSGPAVGRKPEIAPVSCSEVCGGPLHP